MTKRNAIRILAGLVILLLVAGGAFLIYRALDARAWRAVPLDEATRTQYAIAEPGNEPDNPYHVLRSQQAWRRDGEEARLSVAEYTIVMSDTIKGSTPLEIQLQVRDYPLGEQPRPPASLVLVEPECYIVCGRHSALEPGEGGALVSDRRGGGKWVYGLTFGHGNVAERDALSMDTPEIVSLVKWAWDGGGSRPDGSRAPLDPHAWQRSRCLRMPRVNGPMRGSERFVYETRLIRNSRQQTSFDERLYVRVRARLATRLGVLLPGVFEDEIEIPYRNIYQD